MKWSIIVSDDGGGVLVLTDGRRALHKRELASERASEGGRD